MLQEVRLPRGLYPQDVDVGTLGHAHVPIPPAVNVDEIHHLVIAIPSRPDGLVGLHHAVFGALQNGIVVRELEQRHVACVLEHRSALSIVQAREVQIGGLVAVIAAWRKLPLIVVVVLAAATTALLRMA